MSANVCQPLQLPKEEGEDPDTVTLRGISEKLAAAVTLAYAIVTHTKEAVHLAH